MNSYLDNNALKEFTQDGIEIDRSSVRAGSVCTTTIKLRRGNANAVISQSSREEPAMTILGKCTLTMYLDGRKVGGTHTYSECNTAWPESVALSFIRSHQK